MHGDILKLLHEVQDQVVGLRTKEAVAVIREKGLKSRFIMVDGQASMITADAKHDRIGLLVNRGVVTGTQLG